MSRGERHQEDCPEGQVLQRRLLERVLGGCFHVKGITSKSHWGNLDTDCSFDRQPSFPHLHNRVLVLRPLDCAVARHDSSEVTQNCVIPLGLGQRLQEDQY